MTLAGLRGRLKQVALPGSAGREDRAKQAGLAERTARGEFIRMARRVTPYVAVEVDGALYFVNTSDENVGYSLFVKQSRMEHRHLANALHALHRAGIKVPRDTFVDVGANIGTTTLDAYRRHGFRSVIAFEPEPENYKLLRLNVFANAAEAAIRSLNLGLSDRDGTADLIVNPTFSGLHWIAGEAAPAGGQPGVQVRVASLDSLVREGVVEPDAISFLWMDVQGHEAHVFAGATTLLRRGVPVVFELSPSELQRAGRLEHLPRLIAEHYTHVLDLRRASAKNPAFVAVGELPRLVEEYAESTTNVLAARLPDA